MSRQQQREAETGASFAHMVVPPDQTVPEYEPRTVRDVDSEAQKLRDELAELEKAEELNALRAQLAKRKAELRIRSEAREAVPTHDPDRDSPNTWILLPEAGNEVMLAEAWLDVHCPLKREQRMIESVLDLAQLRREDSVMCLLRGKGKRNPLTMEEQHKTDMGEVISSPRPFEELFPEISLSPVIHCRDHWEENAGFGRHQGKLRQSTFLEALGAVCAPCSPRFIDVASAVKGELPRLLVLRGGT